MSIEFEFQWPDSPGEFPCPMDEPCAHALLSHEHARTFAGAAPWLFVAMPPQIERSGGDD